MAGELAQQGAQVLAAAFAEITQQSIELRRRQGRGGGEARVVAVLARQYGEYNAALACQRRQPLDPVFPPIEAAEQPDHNYLGMRANTVDPQIDRHRVTQVAQMREPHARQRGALRVPRGCQGGEVAVGERQYRDIAGRLAEVDRFDNLVEIRRSRCQQVHVSLRR